MMGITQKVAREFREAVRDRGLVYFNKGRVAITASSPGEVVARVRGTDKYKVRVRLRGIKLIASCSCPYSGSNGGAPCKHLWATVLAVDARGLLPSAPTRPLRLVTEPAPGQSRRPPGPDGPPAPYGRENQGPGPGPGVGPGPGSEPGSYPPSHAGGPRSNPPYEPNQRSRPAGPPGRPDPYSAPGPRSGTGYGPGPNQGYGPGGGNGRGAYPGSGSGSGANAGSGPAPNYGPNGNYGGRGPAGNGTGNGYRPERGESANRGDRSNRGTNPPPDYRPKPTDYSPGGGYGPPPNLGGYGPPPHYRPDRDYGPSGDYRNDNRDRDYRANSGYGPNTGGDYPPRDRPPAGNYPPERGYGPNRVPPGLPPDGSAKRPNQANRDRDRDPRGATGPNAAYPGGPPRNRDRDGAPAPAPQPPRYPNPQGQRPGPSTGQRPGPNQGQRPGPNPAQEARMRSGPGANTGQRPPGPGAGNAARPRQLPPSSAAGPYPRGVNGAAGAYRPAPGASPASGPSGRPGPPGPPNQARERRGRGVTGHDGPEGNIHPQHAKAQARAAREARLAALAQQKAKRLLAYVLDIPATLAANQVVIDLTRRARRPNGDWGPLKPWWHTPNLPVVRYDPEDRDLLTELVAAQNTTAVAAVPSKPDGHGEAAGTRRFLLRGDAQAGILEQLARSGRLRLRRTDGEEDPPTVRWDDQGPWRFGLDVKCDPTGKRWTWRGVLRRPDGRGGTDKMDLAEPMAVLPSLIVQGVGKVAPFDDLGLNEWVAKLRQEKEVAYPDSAAQDDAFEKLLPTFKQPARELIESETVKFQEPTDLPQPCLTLRTPRQNWGTDRLIAELGFDYSGAYVPIIRGGNLAVRTDLNLVIHRQVALEQAAGIQLYELGFKDAKDHLLDPGSLEIPAKRVPQVTKELVSAGWRVEAEGKLIRPAGEFKLAVTTGIDWFELGGQVDFGGQSVALPDLLAAARQGETMVTLGDGSMGMLPEDWLKKYGMLADLGIGDEAEGGSLRFGKAQAGLLDALLASQPEIKLDIGFGKVRQNLPRFEGVIPKEAPPGFRGELRPYQCEGLGWLEYLQKFDFGGILADDMGLGKTVQVLALLQSRRARRQSKGPSLIVVPRSLVFNWVQEAEKFCPRLRVLDYTGTGRHATRDDFGDYDLIVTTYGTLRTDIVDLSAILFDYVILDEAQAIKNADSQAAKAARLLQGRHRLAMSGTPIENHLGELWSIFEFLNPGMLGTASVFKKHAAGASAADEGARSLLARALRPFILRRTKKQVVDDLPDKVEQTLFCDLEPPQRQMYEDLKAHYRQALLRKETPELGRSKIEVLEALLRLRQAACHPGLIDPDRAGDPSAKLDMLMPQLAEVAEEGHKILVFSQFTKFLGLVRDRLDADGIKYEYLDGRTRNRAERVESFQNDPTIPLFLISLKAGGLGLNLTSADYVYLLDPWWNPAVEAQAIDRSHRIGQTQQVFAYRLIAKDTVEQKILELQQKKRDLADAILDENRNVIGTLTRDDLEFLLS